MTIRPEHWRDSAQGYGYITRFLHWSMALLFVWQFTSALLRLVADETPVATFFWRSHHSIGFALFILVLLRGVWGLVNIRRRPAHERSLMGRLALTGHLALYALMIVIPSLAILRAYGRGRGFSPFGIQIFDATGVEIQSLIAPASALHGLLGWILLALIVGHIGMALAHRYVWKDGVFQRMVRTARLQSR